MREDDGLTLVDTLVRGNAAALLAAAEALGAPIVRIVLTHGHADHAGSLDALHAHLPDVPVLVSAREARLLDGDQTMEPGEPPFGGARVLRTRTRPTDVLVAG